MFQKVYNVQIIKQTHIKVCRWSNYLSSSPTHTHKKKLEYELLEIFIVCSNQGRLLSFYLSF